MKSIGEHLRTAREEKGFSFDQVVHDTNISREYIYALEGDDFDFFPAEAYLIGFLRNYSEYLGLDPSKMVDIYKNFKISEEPVPMDLLLGKKKAAPEKKEKEKIDRTEKGRPRWLIPVIIVLVIAAASASLLFLPSIIKKDSGEAAQQDTAQAADKSSTPKEFFLTEDTLDINVTSGDSIKVSTGSKVMTFNVKLTDAEKIISYTDKDGAPAQMALADGGEQVVLLDDTTGVYFLVKKVSPLSVTLVAQKVAVDENGSNNAEAGNDSAAATAVAAEQTSVSANTDKTVIMTESYPKTYEINASFRGDTLFRYEADGESRVERFFQAGDKLKIDVSRNLLIWTSNAGNVDIKISGKEISIGENGEVVVQSVKWVKNNETGKYELVIVPVD